MEEELKRLRRLGRTKREPVAGIGGTVQRLREKKGLGLRELATASLMSAGSISRLEQEVNANPNLNTIERLAVGLELTTLELVAAYMREKRLNAEICRREPEPGQKEDK